MKDQHKKLVQDISVGVIMFASFVVASVACVVFVGWIWLAVTLLIAVLGVGLSMLVDAKQAFDKLSARVKELEAAAKKLDVVE